MKLLFYRPPMHDELLYGWIRALAKLNFPEDEEAVYKTAVFLFPYSRPPETRYRLLRGSVRMDYMMGMDDSLQRLRSNGYAIKDVKEIITYNTPLVASGISKVSGDQARYLHTCLRSVNGEMLDMPVMTMAFRNVRVCPQCLKEGQYLRTWHHLPGVTACAVHGLKLVEQTVERNRTSKISYKTREREPASEQEIAYAQYVKSIYDNPSAVDVRMLKAALSNRPLVSSGKRSYAIDRSESFVLFVKYLMEGEPDYTQLLERCVKERTQRRIQQQTAIDGKFNFLSRLGQMVTLQCCDCGKEFTTSFSAIQTGFGCPECDRKKDPTDFINGILGKIGDGAYELESDLQGMRTYQRILHRTCGKVANVRITRRIWLGEMCACEKKYSLQEVQEIVDSLAQGFQVVSYEPIKCKIELEHTCGRRTIRSMQSFKIGPTCIPCRIDQENAVFSKKLIGIMGEGYEVKQIKTHQEVTLRHKPCKTVFMLGYAEIKGGKRCPLCKKRRKVRSRQKL